MQKQNKEEHAPASVKRGERKAALQTYEKKRVRTLSEHEIQKQPQREIKEARERLSMSHTFTAPLLCAAVYLLVLLTGTLPISSIGTNARDMYLSLSAVQLFVFMIPSVFYIRFRSLDMRDDLRLRLPTPDKIMFCVLCTLVLILTSVTLSALGDGLGDGIYTQGYGGAFRQSSFDGTQALYYAVCFAIIPAVCEEMLFRSVIMSEYQKSSIFSAVVINSLLFSMLHFDIALLPFYFFAGVVLSGSTYATNSAVAAFAVHLGYNLFAIFGGGTVDAIVRSLGELTLIIIVSSILLLLFLGLALGECQRIYASYARKNKDSSYLPEYKRGMGTVRFFSALLAPMSLVCILIYIVSALLLK